MSIQSESATLTPAQLEIVAQAEIFDDAGKSLILGDLISGKRVVLIFIRHFWCPTCKAYTRHLSNCIPPQNLPAGTSVIIIGNGQPEPIAAYRESTSSAYPVYAHPSLVIHKALNFHVEAGATPAPRTEVKAYEAGMGSNLMSKIGMVIKDGLSQNPGHFFKVGNPKNHGAEMIMEADGTCSFFHRMENGGDHPELDELAKVIGADYIPIKI